jgi:hypothetical protein
MRGPELGSRYTRPFRIIPEPGQVRQDFSKRRSAVDVPEPGDVLDQDPSGFKEANKTGELGPEPPRVLSALTTTCDGDRLTGEAAAEEINTKSVKVMPECRRCGLRFDVAFLDPTASELVGVGRKRLRIVPPPDVWPVLLQHGPTERINLNLPPTLPSRPLQPQVEPADAREQGPEGRPRPHDAPARLHA